MRKETILDIAKKMMNAGADWQEKLKREVIGTVVLTEYTNKTYMVDDIDFTLNPRSTFKPENKEEETSYADYYKSRYGIDIKDKYQFLLVSKSTARDLRAGRPEMIYLIPELSRATGMTDSMRANFKLMQDLSIYTRLSPENRVKALCKFNKRIQDTPQSVNVLKEWNMELDKKLLEVEGRELPPETIVFGRSHEVPASIKGEWAIRNGVAMYQNVPIHRWLCIYPEKMETDTNKFLEILGQQCQEMQCDYKPPKMISLKDDRQDSYIQAVTAVKDKAPKLILFVLPTDRADRYSALKKACLVDYGIPCQVCIKRTMTNKNVVSIAAKVAIQMSVKLGATPWAIKLPVKGCKYCSKHTTIQNHNLLSLFSDDGRIRRFPSSSRQVTIGWSARGNHGHEKVRSFLQRHLLVQRRQRDEQRISRAHDQGHRDLQRDVRRKLAWEDHVLPRRRWRRTNSVHQETRNSTVDGEA